MNCRIAYISIPMVNFHKSIQSLPAESLSGSCVRVADIDNDGDSDIFVGSRVVPGRYPESPRKSAAD